MKPQYFYLAYAAAALIVLSVMEPMGVFVLCFDVIRGVFRKYAEKVWPVISYVRRHQRIEEDAWSC